MDLNYIDPQSIVLTTVVSHKSNHHHQDSLNGKGGHEPIEKRNTLHLGFGIS